MTTTLKHLEAVCERINNITGNPLKPYVEKNGKHVAQIGNYHLSGAYGGYALHQMDNEGGGIRDIFYGHFPKKELAARMQAFISGLTSK